MVYDNGITFRGSHRSVAGEHGVRARLLIKTIDRAVEIARSQGLMCLPDAELAHLAQQAWANAKLAAHHARRSEGWIP